ncbi:phosphotransferase [Galactobacter valiniphilus]|uniref:phosphotransferase n=1 Tax=Galactobacter valiniphilus TaxID=2676122 RepID=UPI003736875E
MKRSPLDLAAVATAAVPGLSAASVGWLPDDREDFSSALVIDTQGGRWRVRSPRHLEASVRLETELRALGGLSPAIRATLPFSVPSVAGTVRRGELKTFVYHHLDGHVLGLNELAEHPDDLGAQVGRAIAAIHAMDRETLERAGLSGEDAEEYRRARLSELDQVAASGLVPARLLRRWEAAMEDVSLWRFNACAVHGDLHEEQLFVHEGRLVAVTGWSDLHVGDPAEDLAWLLALEDQRVIDRIVEAYSSWRGDKADPHLMTRATLAAEFALARWLARAVTRGDQARIDEAVALLNELDANLRELGDKPIGLVEAAPERPAAAAPIAKVQVLDDAGAPSAAGSGERGAEPEAAEAAASAPEPAPEEPLAEDSANEATAPEVIDSEDEPSGAGDAQAPEEPRSEDDAQPAEVDEADAAPKNAPAAEERSADGAAAASDSEEPGEGQADDDAAGAVITDADVAEPPTEAIAVVRPQDTPEQR